MAEQQPAIGADVTALMVSHQPEPPSSEHPHARVGRFIKENAPMIGGAAGALLTGGASLPLQALAAGAGGAAGSLARGDDLATAGSQGAWEGGTQALGGLAVKGGKAIARGFMRGAVPKNIAKNFEDVDIGQEMLDRGVVPGSARSAKRVSGMSAAANAERDAAAQTVPNMSRRKIIEGIRPIHQKATKGKALEMSEDARDYMRQSAREVGPKGLQGDEALARKDIKQTQATAALNSGNARSAASIPDLANAERGAIVSHLRETPRMATALNESQALMAIDQVMKDAAHSNVVTRGRIGGLTAASLAPIGLGVTAHGLNQGAKVFDPQVVRLLSLIMGGGSHEQ